MNGGQAGWPGVPTWGIPVAFSTPTRRERRASGGGLLASAPDPVSPTNRDGPLLRAGVVGPLSPADEASTLALGARAGQTGRARCSVPAKDYLTGDERGLPPDLVHFEVYGSTLRAVRRISGRVVSRRYASSSSGVRGGGDRYQHGERDDDACVPHQPEVVAEHRTRLDRRRPRRRAQGRRNAEDDRGAGEGSGSRLPRSTEATTTTLSSANRAIPAPPTTPDA